MSLMLFTFGLVLLIGIGALALVERKQKHG